MASALPIHQVKKRKFNRWWFFLLCLIICFLGRGILFRAFIRYEIDQEITYATDLSLPEGLLLSIHQSPSPNSLKDIAFLAQKLVAQHLSFSLQPDQDDPHKGHCVDYARLWSATASEIIHHHHLEDQYTIHHYRGYLYCGSVNLHQFFDSPSFRDHDFNGIFSLDTKEYLYLDVSLYDYTGIRQIRAIKTN